MTNAAGITTYEIGDTALHQGQPIVIADINWNYRPNCPCKDGCARVQFEGGGYARTCELTPAVETPAPVNIAYQVCDKVIRVYNVGPAYAGLVRCEVTNGTGFVIDDLTRTYTSEAAARAAARLITMTLRGIDRLDQLTNA